MTRQELQAQLIMHEKFLRETELALKDLKEIPLKNREEQRKIKSHITETKRIIKKLKAELRKMK